MTCIFCKNNSSDSKSIEHIMPESFGNKTYVLPKGAVCDKCNNYLSIKIEKKLLEQDFFKNLRHRNVIESKKGKIPKGLAIVPKTGFEAEIIFNKEYPIVNVDKESFNAIMNGEVNELIIPFIPEPEKTNRIISRFLCKVGLEALGHRFMVQPGGLDYIVEETQFDPIREYVRYDKSKEYWVYNVRKIYSETEKFYSSDEEKYYDMLYEYDFLCTEHSEIYFVMILKGYEFTINMAGSCLEGYYDWLKTHNNESPLYSKIKPNNSKLKANFTNNNNP
jgi:hypothetical protein